MHPKVGGCLAWSWSNFIVLPSVCGGPMPEGGLVATDSGLGPDYFSHRFVVGPRNFLHRLRWVRVISYTVSAWVRVATDDNV